MESLNSQTIVNQPITNIGMLGSVSDGKSTTVFSLSGVKTQRHSNEMKRNITIKPGYANMKIYEKDGVFNVKGYGDLVHHISFIDCPGHYQLIVTMMSNIRLMDGIILVVSAAEPITMKPQLIQHMLAIKMSGVNNVIVLLNKLDLVSKKVAMERYDDLVTTLAKYDIVPKKIIPVCMNHMIGVETLLDSIMKYMPPRIKNIDGDPLFMVSRSFDVNHVNIPLDDMVGGVVGGSMVRGSFKVGDIIEISPGIITTDALGNTINTPHITTITSLKSETHSMDSIVTGGLIGIGTNIDPYYCKNDLMVGMMVGLQGKLPPVYYDITINYTDIVFDDYVWIKNIGNNIMVISGTHCVDGKITHYDNDTISIKLARPMCIDNMNMIILCDKTKNSFHIVAHGTF